MNLVLRWRMKRVLRGLPESLRALLEGLQLILVARRTRHEVHEISRNYSGWAGQFFFPAGVVD